MSNYPRDYGLAQQAGLNSALANRMVQPSEAQMLAKADEYERRERLARAQHEADEKLQPLLTVIRGGGNPEDLLRAAALLKPLAIEILSR